MAVTEKSAANRTASPSGSAASDNENSERPVREQLKKTSIDPPKAGTSQDDSEPRRKRSREEVDKDTEEESRNVTAAGRHSRKRSRDVDHDSSEDMSAAEKSDASSDVGIRPTTPSRMDLSAEEVEAEKVTSPKGKRNREQFLKDSDDGNTQSLNGATVAPIVDEKAKDQTLSGLKDDGRDAKRHRDDIAKAATGSKVSGEKADAVKVRRMKLIGRECILTIRRSLPEVVLQMYPHHRHSQISVELKQQNLKLRLPKARSNHQVSANLHSHQPLPLPP